MHFYNDSDPYVAQWLGNLIEAGCLPQGTVDARSIIELSARDVAGYRQAHFFAGIGGWSFALELAGWSSDRPVWTGSCPCQPFSKAGQGKAGTDKRHLWPQWFRLIRECRPDTIFSEQVEGAVGLGWLDRVFADLEAEGYACGAAVLGAHSVGAPHIRQRLFWVAESRRTGVQRRLRHSQPSQASGSNGTPEQHDARSGSATGGVADAQCDRSKEGKETTERARRPLLGRGGGDGGMGDATGPRSFSGTHSGIFNAQEDATQECRRNGWGSSRPSRSFWSHAEWIPCLDGKARRTQSGIFPLADGIPSRVGKLRAAGNAIVPPVAAEFIVAAMECLP